MKIGDKITKVNPDATISISLLNNFLYKTFNNMFLAKLTKKPQIGAF